jgi:hypothetical protein
VSGKSPHIRRFLNDLVGGFACSMTRARLNADKVRFVTNIRRLECGDIFEGVPRHYAITRSSVSAVVARIAGYALPDWML